MEKTLEQLNLKSIEPCSFKIAESKDYELFLTRTWDNNTYTIMGLYKVTLPNNRGIFVIAEDSRGAISQVSCSEDTDGAVAVSIPFIVRGWGNAQFNGI